MKEPIPHVSFDFGMGQLVSDIDINYEALVAYMQEQGFDDATIDSTPIYVASDDTLYTGEDGTVYSTNGAYNRKTGAIALYPYRVMYLFDKHASTLSSHEEVEAFRQRMSEHWSERYSEILVHELTHKKRHPAVITEGTNEQPNLTSRSLGTAALSQQEYTDNQEEADCHEAAKAGPKNLVRFQIKPLD